MAIIPLPTKFSFTRIPRFGLLRAGNTLRSKYTGQSQRVTYPFAVWQVQGELVEYDGPEAAAIRSFFSKLDGQKHTFRLPVPGYTRSASGYTGAISVATAAPARQASIDFSGTTASVPIFAEGDYFTINDELKIVTASVASSGTGTGTVNFKPALRKPVAAGTAILNNNPTIIMHSVDDDVASWGLMPPYKHGLTLDAIEAVEI